MPAAGALGRLAPFAALERLVALLIPRMGVAAFVLPFIPLLKLGELRLFLHGHVAPGVLALIATRAIGVALSARLFETARPKMRQVPAFAWAHGHALLESLPAWVATRDLIPRLGAAGRALLAAGWVARWGSNPGIRSQGRPGRRYSPRPPHLFS